MPGADTRDDLALLLDVARAAADLALSFWGCDPRNWLKDARSPVSEADLAVDRLLTERLRPARPDYGWLSEETADSPARLSAKRLFVVDPIDGTRAFLAGKPEWMISLAVVEGGRPLAAALAAPAIGDIYTAVRGAGAFRGGTRIAASRIAEPAEARVAGAKAPLERPLPAFASVVPRIPSLALRFARVSDATLDAAFATPNAHDWDIAGVDLLVHEAGGRLTTLDGDLPRYNTPRPCHPSLFAAGASLHDAVMRALDAERRTRADP